MSADITIPSGRKQDISMFIMDFKIHEVGDKSVLWLIVSNIAERSRRMWNDETLADLVA